MATSFSPKISTIFISNSKSTAIPLLFRFSAANFSASRPLPTSPLHLHRPPPVFRTHSATGPTPPPESDPDEGNSSIQLSGFAEKLSRFQETARIFFAVLFWMSLFFWSSVWEGDKPDKGPPFRR